MEYYYYCESSYCKKQYPENEFLLCIHKDNNDDDYGYDCEKYICKNCQKISLMCKEHNEGDKTINEKNEYINFLENRPENHDCKHCPNKEKLFKEDFNMQEFCDKGKSVELHKKECWDNNVYWFQRYYLKDNSKYDNLPSKEELK
ncbi:hypothetical protein [Spiroplasma endosymbiont of Stenodema calcarata]|uniref:hypothetical protein n=1 Tax=Spiroplasma endosymbiont of Stenodema calcarata TaxID=3139328 RepID=UPI003CCB4052